MRIMHEEPAIGVLSHQTGAGVGLEPGSQTRHIYWYKYLCRACDNAVIARDFQLYLTRRRMAVGARLGSSAEQLIVRYHCHAFYT